MRRDHKSRHVPKLDTELPFTCLSEDFLRSRDGREIPPPPGRYIAGACYPTADDLSEFLSESQRGSQLSWACPIVATADGSRTVLYARPLTLAERRRDAHIAAWGPTGAGKTTRVTLPLLLSS